MIALMKRVEFWNDMEDNRTARILAIIANVNSKDKKYDVEDFMPLKDGKEREKQLSPEETAEYFKSFAIEAGGVVKDGEGNVIDGDPQKTLPPANPN